MKYRPHYLKKKKRHELNEFSIKGGRIAINGKLLDGVTSYSIDWKSGELTGLTINMVGKMK
ncbi:hypothetical protein [Streptococcus oralis]|uniref:hypothetical protein n=1 Tax=Streptococcus oralis TaxID=1303 RepID=UPI0019D0DFE6|nr:hypothetical protein [Streptococcus oralis]MBN6012521.1 hypothetical protein [Streptococcus oralis subsp. oralis]